MNAETDSTNKSDVTGGHGLAPSPVRHILSPTQNRILRWAGKAPNGHIIVAGNKQAPFISAARSLVRKGLLIEWKTSHYAITGAGEEYIMPNADVLARGESATPTTPKPQ